MKTIVGICIYNQDQERLAKKLKIPVVCYRKDFKNSMEIFNHLFTETNKLCTQWNDVVVLINECTFKENLISEITKLFTKNTELNMLDVAPSNIYKKLADYRTLDTINNESYRVFMDIYNRFDIKIFRHFIYNLVEGINIEKTIELDLDSIVFSLFNKNMEYIDKLNLGAYITNPKLDKMTTALNKNVKKVDYPKHLIGDSMKGLQIYKKLDV